jgi:hypothetical protein
MLHAPFGRARPVSAQVEPKPTHRRTARYPETTQRSAVPPSPPLARGLLHH